MVEGSNNCRREWFGDGSGKDDVGQCVGGAWGKMVVVGSGG